MDKKNQLDYNESWDKRGSKSTGVIGKENMLLFDSIFPASLYARASSQFNFSDCFLIFQFFYFL